MIGLDTSTVIDIFKGEEKVKMILNKIDEELAITQITYLELLFGLDLEKKSHRKELSYYKALFNNVTIVELTTDACEKAANIFMYLKKKGKTVPQFDCTIAGALLSRGVTTIITKNKKHFEHIPGLKVIQY